MLNVKRGKRKRKIQTTLDEIFKRQRPLALAREGSSTMTDVVEVAGNSSEEDEMETPQSNDMKQNQAGKLTGPTNDVAETSSPEDEMETLQSNDMKQNQSEKLTGAAKDVAGTSSQENEMKTPQSNDMKQNQSEKLMGAAKDVAGTSSQDDEMKTPKSNDMKPIQSGKLTGSANDVAGTSSPENEMETFQSNDMKQNQSEKLTGAAKDVAGTSSQENEMKTPQSNDMKPIQSGKLTGSTNDVAGTSSQEDEVETLQSNYMKQNQSGKLTRAANDEIEEFSSSESDDTQEASREIGNCEQAGVESLKLEANNKRKELDKKSSETTIETIVIESSQESTSCSENTEVCLSDLNNEIPLNIVKEETNSSIGDDEVLSRASEETSDGKGISRGDQDHFIQDVEKTRNEDNRELPEQYKEIVIDNENKDRREHGEHIEMTCISAEATEFKVIADQDEIEEGGEAKSYHTEKEDNDERRLSKGNEEIQEGEVSFKESKERKNESDDETQNYELLPEDESHREHIEEPVRLGVDFDTLLRAPGSCGPQQELTPSQTHTILFRPYHLSQPYPRSYRDKWDHDHVRMPCSPQNKFPVPDHEGKKLLSRWELIRRALNKPMTSSYDLESAILSYHTRNFNFKILHILLIENMTPEEHKEFIEFTLPGIIQMALALPQMCTQSIPLLRQQKERTITMSQQQAACLLACGFLCIFPKRNPGGYRNRNDEFSNLPSMNFFRLFELDATNRPSLKKIEKLKCILHYFKRVLQQPPQGSISFKRQVLKPDEAPKWNSSQTRLCRLRVTSDGTIEDNAPGLLQVDFANQMVGGGVLSEGCVQEEIRFAICPELIVSRLLTERLQDNECLIVTGAERFSDYVGYAGNFQWAGNHVDQIPRDSWGRLHTEVVAIDAKPHINYKTQFSPGHIKRELEKAFIGFLSRETASEHLPAVATGKWGCGAFNGNPQLKSLIQIMAASAAHRDMLYFTFQDTEHARELHEMHSLLYDSEITIGQLWQIIFKFQKELNSETPTSLDLFGYIHKVLGRSDDEISP